MRQQTDYSLTILLFLCLVTCAPAALAWNSIFLGTHERITDDGIHSLDGNEYPDIYLWDEALRDGSETEAHYPPGIPNEQHRWAPEPEDWWQRRDDQNQKCALQHYEDRDVYNAYLKIGYLIHLVQDTFVPAHQCIIIHGAFYDYPLDGLEDYADGHFNYCINCEDCFGSTPWTFNYALHTWQYWLSDSLDDDDGDNQPDDSEGNGGGIRDDGGRSEEEWGVSNDSFGSYGCGDGTIAPMPPESQVPPPWWDYYDEVPGKNEGFDGFWYVPNQAIAHQRLRLAYLGTVFHLEAKSRLLPPLIWEGPEIEWTNPYSSEPDTPIFGPNSDPVTIRIEVAENRKPKVRVTVAAGGIPIVDMEGMAWDGSPPNAWTLPHSDAPLPWKGAEEIGWDGTLAGGFVANGRHEVRVSAVDQDGNAAPPKSTVVRYDAVPPTGSIEIVQY